MAHSPTRSPFCWRCPLRSSRRHPRWLADAKREGTLTLYTSLAPTESQPLADAFEKKYGVKVQLWRGCPRKSSSGRSPRQRAGAISADVIETNGPEMEMIAREQLLAGAWSPDRLNLFVVGYNTSKVKRAEIPATYEGFTDPKWKGRIALEATDSEWMATLIKTIPGGKGTELMRGLAALQPSLRKGHVLLASLVAAGDVPVGLAMLQQQHRDAETEGRADRFRPGAAGRRASAGHRRGEARAASQRRPAVRGVRALARGPEAVRVHGPGPGQYVREEQPEQLPVRRHRSGHGARRV